LAYALVGFLCPIPWLGVGAGIIAVAVWQRLPEGFGPGVNLLCWLGAGWGSSAMSGWLCGRYLAHRERRTAPVAVFLANSSAWTAMAFAAIPIVDMWNDVMFSNELIPVLAIAAFVTGTGFLITGLLQSAI
jgi:hypothetical protein